NESVKMNAQLAVWNAADAGGNDNIMCHGQVLTSETQDGCNLFLKDLIKNNAKYTYQGKLYSMPGTYVKKTGLCNGQAYRVVNVVSGAAGDNQIYLLDADNKYVGRMSHRTQYNATFINEAAEFTNKKDKNDYRRAGDKLGVYNNSYIFFHDVTGMIDALYSRGRGTNRYSVGTFASLMPADKIPHTSIRVPDWLADMGYGAYDFKVSWTRHECDPENYGFRVPGQSDVAAHTNGVLYNGAVVTLEQLGHIITGMHTPDSVAPDAAIETAVTRLQGGAESPYANELRAAAQTNTAASKDDTTFIKTKTRDESTAFALARRHMAHKYGLDERQIRCSGTCNTGLDSFYITIAGGIRDTNDFVSCNYTDGATGHHTKVIYQFDSICNGNDKNIPDV
ncbi:MAG: hypothetical protein K2L94_00235, partial [Alphaproteobacteria bacterium]|nr:hypothetical protein [Alphaproteobacteria bacterium]